MTDKEFRRLSRAQLMDIIYQLQLEVDTLTQKNQQLEKALADKRFRIENAGDLAKAALEISDCFRSAQKAADLYLNEIKALHKEAEAERTRILAQAREEADGILAEAKSSQTEQTAAIEAILEEYRNNDSDNG